MERGSGRCRGGREVATIDRDAKGRKGHNGV
jgi:hypothetical protein